MIYRDLGRTGLRVDTDTRLRRQLRLSTTGGTLVVTCADTAPIRVSLDGSELPRLSTLPFPEHRFQLPQRIDAGELSIRAAGDVQATVLSLTLLAAVQ